MPKETEVDCPTCGGEGSFSQDAWSYGDSRGRGEGHYTIDRKCACCKGQGAMPAEEAEKHAADDDCSEPDYPEPEPEPYIDLDDGRHFVGGEG